jgi:histidine ammonia-lyase
MPSAVTISTRPMQLHELLEIAAQHKVVLDPGAIDVIRDSRAVVEAALASGRAVYGLNMGLGHMKDTRLPQDQLRELQRAMVDGHAGAIGPPLPAAIVRAAMGARVNGIARGGSGATLACAETYVAMLNAGVHPIVPAFGSVGASDLAQMAAIAQVAIGGGEAELNGETLPGAEALRRAGIHALTLAPKDGLALMSANGVSVGHGAIVAASAERALELAGVAAVLSLEAMSGNVSPFDAAVAEAKGVRGQVAVSDHVRALLRGSRILADDPARSVQDPLSFRVVPQVHGAAWELIRFAGAAVETELNAMTDNPLVDRGRRRMISNGNFHPMLLALAFDALRPALAHVGQLSDRRLNHLWAATFEKGADQVDANRSVWGSSGDRRGTSMRYAAAAAAAELRQLAGPATLDVAPLDLGIEDHATGAPLSVRRTEAAIERLEDVLAVELIMARDLLMARKGASGLGAGGAAALRAVNSAVKGSGPAPDSRRFHDAVLQAMALTLLNEVGSASARLD